MKRRPARVLALSLLCAATAAVRPLGAQSATQSSGRFDFGLGAAVGVAGFRPTSEQESALGAHWGLVGAAVARERPLGLRVEYTTHRVASQGDSEAAPCFPSMPCSPKHGDRQRISSLVGSVTWGLRASRSGAYVLGGAGVYRTTFESSAYRAATGAGVHYGAGLLYHLHRGGGSLFLEARGHHVATASAGSFAPIAVGFIF